MGVLWLGLGCDLVVGVVTWLWGLWLGSMGLWLGSGGCDLVVGGNGLWGCALAEGCAAAPVVASSPTASQPPEAIRSPEAPPRPTNNRQSASGPRNQASICQKQETGGFSLHQKHFEAPSLKPELTWSREYCHLVAWKRSSWQKIHTIPKAKISEGESCLETKRQKRIKRQNAI